MADRSDSIVVDRPVETVFAYVTDVTNDPAWHTDVLEAQKTSEGPIGVGEPCGTRGSSRPWASPRAQVG